RAREGLAAARRQHALVEALDERALRGREQRAQVRALERRDRVVDLAGGIVERQHELRALEGRERGAERAQGRVEVARLGRAQPGDAEPACDREPCPGAEADQERAAIEQRRCHAAGDSAAVAGGCFWGWRCFRGRWLPIACVLDCLVSRLTRRSAAP